jgi:Lon protease-like protein
VEEEPLPQSWPPSPGPVHVAPVFPLPGVFLFPLQILPLHIFEPRYRKMIEDSLDGPGRIVLATVPENHAGELDGAPPVLPIAGLGEIARHQRLPDGRFLVWLAAHARFPPPPTDETEEKSEKQE